MELHQLRYFRAVARTGNFTRAAASEHVTQPSLSQQILKLEDELGAKLFERFPRNAKLTQFGTAFLPKAEAILRQIGEARTEIQEMAGAEKGKIVVGAIPTIAPYFLPALLTSFARQHPTVQVSVFEEITPILLERLHDGRIDMALLALPVRGEELVCEELFQESLYVVLPAKHRLAKRGRIRLREIKNEPFLLLREGHCFRENAISACQRSNLDPSIVFESGQFSGILAMVSAGMGVSIAPAMAVEKRKGCKFIRVDDDHACRKVGLVQRRNHFSTRSQRALIDHLKQMHKQSSGQS
jgi:LysR family hydrogen peroxide-inducible transcriptional activator